MTRLPFVSAWLKKIKRRFGIAAPSVVVRGSVSLRWYFVAATLFLVVFAVIILFFFGCGEGAPVSVEVETLRLKVRALDDELLMLRSTAGTEQNLAMLERSAQRRLLERVSSLEAENSALREDMLLFERLIPIPGEDAVVRIESFRLNRDAEARFRYRLLVAYQPGRLVPEFKGRLQLVLVYNLGEKENQITLPDKKNGMLDFSIDTKHFWRKEGVIELPVGAQLVRAEARVLQGDTLKSKRIAQL